VGKFQRKTIKIPFVVSYPKTQIGLLGVKQCYWGSSILSAIFDSFL